jgi:LacI family transcriptional regulator
MAIINAGLQSKPVCMKSRTNKKRTPPRVALLIETSHAYGRNLLVGIAQYVRAHGPWSIEFEEGQSLEKVPDWFKQWKGDGILARVKQQAVAAAISKLGLPIVDLYCDLPDLKMAKIRSDEICVGQMAAQHLLDRGFRNFAFCGFNGTHWSDLRQTGFCQTIKEAGYSCQKFNNSKPQPRQMGLEYEEHGIVHEQRIGDWIKELTKPVGLMACNDARARQVLNICRILEISIPDQIALISVDNDDLLIDLSDLPVSSVILNAKRVGFEAAKMLESLMAGKPMTQETILVEPVGIATRRSTDVLSVEDPNLAKAMLYLRDHACEGLSVDQVAAYAGVSRSVLQRKFRQTLNQTIHNAIVNVRIKRACELLSGTNLSLIDIAEKSGFKHCEYMGAVFKSYLKKTPFQFRNETRIRGQLI